MLTPETLERLAQTCMDEPMLIKSLRRLFPNGHENFLPTIIEQLELHSLKNGDYAGKGPACGNFERVAAILALYPGLDLSDKRVVALVYALKQLDAVLYGISKHITHKVEGLIPRLQDIAVYANIVICMVKEAQRQAPYETTLNSSMYPNTDMLEKAREQHAKVSIAGGSECSLEPLNIL